MSTITQAAGPGTGDPEAVRRHLQERLRSAVRGLSVDPLAEPQRVHELAADVVNEHDHNSLNGSQRPLVDPDAMVADLIAAVCGFGALQAYLDDDEVEEIWINDPSRVFVARSGRHELTTTILSAEDVRELVERMLKQSGRRLDLSSPFVDARLPGGHRLHVVLEGISTDFAAVNIRKFLLRSCRLAELVQRDSLTDQAARFLEAAVVSGLTILVAGATQAGKTTMLNCLAGAIPGNERVVSAEEVRELAVPHPDWVGMECRPPGLEGTGEVTLRDLVRETLRMRPTRVIVGEVRGAEALDLLLAFNSGLPGMATLHANSSREALVKLCTLPMLAGENVASSFVLPTVASSIDLVVFLRMDSDGIRRVHEIVTVSGRVETGVIETEVIFERRDGVLSRGCGVPARADAFERAGIDVVDLLRGDP